MAGKRSKNGTRMKAMGGGMKSKNGTRMKAMGGGAMMKKKNYAKGGRVKLSEGSKGVTASQVKSYLRSVQEGRTNLPSSLASMMSRALKK
jgi:hypothetical protein